MYIKLLILASFLFLVSCEGCDFSTSSSQSNRQNQGNGGGGGGEGLGDIYDELDKSADAAGKAQVIEKYLAKNVQSLKKTNPKNNNNIWHQVLSFNPKEKLVDDLIAKVGLNGFKDKNTDNETPLESAIKNNIAPKLLKKLVDSDVDGVDYNELLLSSIKDNKPDYFKVLFSKYYADNTSLAILLDDKIPGSEDTGIKYLFKNQRDSFCDKYYPFLIDTLNAQHNKDLVDELFSISGLKASLKNPPHSAIETTLKDIEPSTPELKKVKNAFLNKDAQDFALVCKEPKKQMGNLLDDLTKEDGKNRLAAKEQATKKDLEKIDQVIEEVRDPKNTYVKEFSDKIDQLIDDVGLKFSLSDEVKQKVEDIKKTFARVFNNFITKWHNTLNETREEFYLSLLEAKNFEKANKSFVTNYNNLSHSYSSKESEYKEAMKQAIVSSKIKTTDDYVLLDNGFSYSLEKREARVTYSRPFSIADFKSDAKYQLTKEAKTYLEKNVKPRYDEFQAANNTLEQFEKNFADQEGLKNWKNHRNNLDDPVAKLEELKQIKEGYQKALLDLAEELKKLRKARKF